MLFNSIFFITTFLPLCLVGWYLLQRLENPVFAKIFLAGMSFWFYGYYNIKYLWILLASIGVNYTLSLLFERTGTGTARKAVLGAGLSANLGMLFYFKYFNFFLDNCSVLLHADLSVEKIALPLGISFFTFQQISFIVDRYKGLAPSYSFWDYCCFVSFFPQLVAGPIVLHEKFIPQLQERKNRSISGDAFFDGAALFILGLSKKVLLADSLAVLVDAEYNNIPWLDMPSAWCVIIFYMLELYFDFSGYCDMARGLGKLFGFELPENFNSPLMATSVKDFWKRWHMTLSGFFGRYVYIPLGGNRKGKPRQCLNLFIVFLLSGLWHGANWTFVVWGLMHGLAEIWETLFPRLRFKHDWANRAVTGLFVTLSFSIFRSESLAQTVLLWKKLFAGGFTGMFVGICNTMNLAETFAVREVLRLYRPGGLNFVYVGTVLFLLGLSLFFVAGRRAEEWLDGKGRTTFGCFQLATLFLWSLCSLSRVSVFLYFNF